MENLITKDIYDVYSKFSGPLSMNDMTYWMLYLAKKLFDQSKFYYTSSCQHPYWKKNLWSNPSFLSGLWIQNSHPCQKVPFEVYINMNIYLFSLCNNDSG